MRSISLEIFCDEVKEITVSGAHEDSRKWSYIGALVVPTDKKQALLNQLLDRRCSSRNDWTHCDKACTHHSKNDKEVHYQALREADVYHIAKRWLEFFLEDRELTSFYLLGINLSRLNFDFFGDSKGSARAANIYNRFFRTVLSKPTKAFHSRYDTINIQKVFHDSSDLETHEKFPWHSIEVLDKTSTKLSFSSAEIHFIDSDHRKSGVVESHLIQYIDLLLGLAVNCFHANGRHEKTVDLTKRIAPIIRRLVEAPGNVNSSYSYVNRLAIDFFPKNSISTEENAINEALRLDAFYKKRALRIEELGQQELFGS
jgi:hypothetical protein